ncbi:MAG TPA: HlyD family efflux transporter periplasmic adaptor subunit [Bacteroidetes bacterium]|nr:HlyD family efflux transporter periplasmic adaptor subunit [Bacteroidota bacterium]
MSLKSISLFIFSIVLAGCGNGSDKNIYTGVIEGKSIQVPALIPGKLVQLNADTGDRVIRGQVLAVVDSIELVYRSRQIKAGLQGITVQKKIAKTSLQRAQADLGYMKEKYERMERLVAGQTMPQQQADDVKVLLQRAQSARKVAAETMQSLAAKREQLLAQLQAVKKKINDCVVTAPDDGIIATKFFERGEAIPPLSPVVEIIHIDTVEVKIYVAERMLPQIKYGQEVAIRIDGMERKLTGKINWISPKAEFTPKIILTPETRSSLVYAVKITIPNPDGLLKHGMPVEVVLAH